MYIYIYLYPSPPCIHVHMHIIHIYIHVYIYMAFGYEGNGKAVFKKTPGLEFRIVWVAVKVSRRSYDIVGI